MQLRHRRAEQRLGFGAEPSCRATYSILSFHSLKAAFDDQGLGVDDIDVITTPWEMKSLRRNLFRGAAEGLPASLDVEFRQAHARIYRP